MRFEWNNCKVVLILLILSLVACAQSVESESIVPIAEPTVTPIPTLPPEPTSAPIQNTPTPIVIVVTATPTLIPTQTPTSIPLPIFTPTAVRKSLPVAIPTLLPTSTPTSAPTVTVTVTPTPTATPIPLPLELTGGIKALVACAGRDEEYWLRNGPPRMTLELVQCLNAELEKGQ